MVSFTCNGMTIEVARDALADVLSYVRNDTMRASLLRRAEAARAGEPVPLSTTPFDALLDAVSERERGLLDDEEAR